MDILLLGMILCVLVIASWAVWKITLWQTKCCFARLDNWASENGFRIVERKYVQFWVGPFWWRRWYTDLAVYRVVVEDSSGCRLIAYVRLSGWLRPRTLTVRWQDAKPERECDATNL